MQIDDADIMMYTNRGESIASSITDHLIIVKDLMGILGIKNYTTNSFFKLFKDDKSRIVKIPKEQLPEDLHGMMTTD